MRNGFIGLGRNARYILMKELGCFIDPVQPRGEEFLERRNSLLQLLRGEYRRVGNGPASPAPMKLIFVVRHSLSHPSPSNLCGLADSLSASSGSSDRNTFSAHAD